MRKPATWSLEPRHFNYRVLFNFVSPSGGLIKSKTWQIAKTWDEPAKTFLLQAHARLADREKKPVLRELGPNYVAVTTVVSSLLGDLLPMAFDGPHELEKIKEQLSRFPLSLALVVENAGIHFTLHTVE